MAQRRPYPTDKNLARVIHLKAKRLSQNPAFGPDDEPDIQQDLMLHALERWDKYDPRRQRPQTFLGWILDNKVRNMIDERCAAMRDHRRNAGSLDENVSSGPEVNGSESRRTRHEIYDRDAYFGLIAGRDRSTPEAMELEIDVRAVLKTLSEDLRHVANLRTSMTISEIAVELGVSRASLYEKCARIRQVLKAAGLDEYVKPGRGSA